MKYQMLNPMINQKIFVILFVAALSTCQPPNTPIVSTQLFLTSQDMLHQKDTRIEIVELPFDKHSGIRPYYLNGYLLDSTLYAYTMDTLNPSYDFVYIYPDFALRGLLLGSDQTSGDTVLFMGQKHCINNSFTQVNTTGFEFTSLHKIKLHEKEYILLIGQMNKTGKNFTGFFYLFDVTDKKNVHKINMDPFMKDKEVIAPSPDYFGDFNHDHILDVCLFINGDDEIKVYSIDENHLKEIKGKQIKLLRTNHGHCFQILNQGTSWFYPIKPINTTNTDCVFEYFQ